MRPPLLRTPVLRLVVVGLATVCLAGGPARAAIVVLSNQTRQNVAMTVRLTGQPEKQVTLAPNQLIPLPVTDAASVDYHTGKVGRRVPLDPNCLYYFVPEEDEVVLKRAVFSGVGGVPWIHVDPSGKVPPPVVVPVKILTDDEQPAAGRLWEPALKRQLEVASQLFRQYCRVEFRVVEAGSWESDDQLRSFRQLYDQFRREVSPGKARLAIGITSQYRMTRPEQVPHDTREPLYTHLLLPAVQENFTAQDQLSLLVHELAHFLGAVALANDDSVMGLRFPRSIEKLRDGGLTFDPVNTLVMNMLAEEIRVHDVRSLGDVPRSTRKYLHAIYAQVSRSPSDEAARYATLVEEAVAKHARYTATWTDGSEQSADGVEGWGETSSRPKLAGQLLLDTDRSIRWLVDHAHPQPGPPPAMVELFGGDVLPGRVIGFRSGIESDRLRLPPHLLVSPDVPVDWPDGPVRQTLQVPTRWVRRIVWQRVAQQYRPSTLIYRDGRRLEFRSLRPGEGGIQLLTAEGVRQVMLDEIAELHLAPSDPWDSYFEQVAVLSPDGTSRLMRLETADGLRVTSSMQRFQARSRGSKSRPENWYHVVQPAWCLQPLWIPHERIRLRCYFQPQEVALSRIDPSSCIELSDLGGVWPRRADRNVEGGPLVGGDREYHWGLGVHAMSELTFPLPACARSFQTRLGLDALAGEGGCVLARIYQGSPSGEPLYASRLLIGSTDVLDTGPLALAAASDRPAPLVLVVDPADRQRPRGADPLDIRDHLDWLEPLVLLDPEGLREELDRRAAGLVPAWIGWTVAVGRQQGPLLRDVWTEAHDSRDGAYESLVSGAADVKVSRSVWISEENDRLLIAATRPPGTPATKIEVQVDGRLLGRFDLPEHRSSDPPEPIEVSLADYREKQVTVEIVQQSDDPASLVRWWSLAMAGSAKEAAGQ